MKIIEKHFDLFLYIKSSVFYFKETSASHPKKKI